MITTLCEQYRAGFIRLIVLIVAWTATWGAIGLENAPAQTSSGTFWSGWLGPERNGWVEGFRPLIQWPEQLKQGWQVEVGTGYGSPLVADGLVYQHARQGDDEVVIKERWHQEEVALNMSTAVVNGELLFGFSHYNKGQFFCLDIESGKVLWQGPGRTGDNVMFLSVPGYIAALINDGRLQIIATRGDRFEQVASYRVAESNTYAPPVLLPNGFLVKDLKTLSFWSMPCSATSSQ